MPENIQFNFSCSFFLHGLSAQFTLECMGPFKYVILFSLLSIAKITVKVVFSGRNKSAFSEAALHYRSDCAVRKTHKDASQWTLITQVLV